MRLHVVTDSDLVFLGLPGKCAKLEQQGWVASRGLLAHVSLWTDLWNRWRLLRDSVTIQWVPSHVGVQGNERAHEGAARGWAQEQCCVIGGSGTFGVTWASRRWMTPVMMT